MEKAPIYIDVKSNFIKSIGMIPTIGTKLKNDHGIPITDDSTKAIILTNLGLIEGEIISLDYEMKNKSEDQTLKLFSTVLNKADELLRKTVSEEEAKLINHTKAFLVKNAKIHNNSNFESTISLPYLWLFSDQVLGITFGSLKD